MHKLVNYNLRPTEEHSIFFCEHFWQTDKKTGIGIYQHRLWQATTCKQHTIIYEHTKKEDNFLKFATTNKNSTFDLATSAQQIVRQKQNRPAQKHSKYFLFY